MYDGWKKVSVDRGTRRYEPNVILHRILHHENLGIRVHQRPRYPVEVWINELLNWAYEISLIEVAISHCEVYFVLHPKWVNLLLWLATIIVGCWIDAGYYLELYICLDLLTVLIAYQLEESIARRAVVEVETHQVNLSLVVVRKPLATFCVVQWDPRHYATVPFMT